MTDGWSRRSLLAAGGSGLLTALAGCNALDGGDSTRELTLTVDRLDADSLAATVLWDPDPDTWAGDQNRALRAAVTGEDYRTHGYAPLPADAYAEYDGDYYRLDEVVVGSITAERPVLNVEILGQRGEEGVPDPEVDAEALPRLDERALKIARILAWKRSRGFEVRVGESMRHDGGYLYRRHGVVDSDLAPESAYRHVALQDEVLSVTVSTATVDLPTYRPVATRVATDRAGLDAVLRATTLDAEIGPESLSSDAQSILEAAIVRETYAETDPIGEAFLSVLSELGFEVSETGTRGYECAASDNGRYLQYDGTLFRYGLYCNFVE